MGWTGRYTNQSATDVVRDEIQYGGSNRVLANRGAKWWLVENVKTGTVFPVIALVKRRGGELLTKLMTDEEGPHECGYPLEWLPKLSPTDGEYAIQWRERVRKYHADKKAKPTLKVGDRVVFDHPIEFTDGSKYNELVYRGKWKFVAPGMRLVRMSRDWRTRYTWTVIPAEIAPVRTEETV